MHDVENTEELMDPDKPDALVGFFTPGALIGCTDGEGEGSVEGEVSSGTGDGDGVGAGEGEGVGS